MTKIKNLLFYFVITFLLFGTVTFVGLNNQDEVIAQAESSPTVLLRGTFDGGSVNWVLDSEYCLTISGYGAIPALSGDRPWNEDLIKKLVIEEGISDISAGVFTAHKQLEDIYFPSSLTRIGSGTFINCTALKNIYFSEGLTYLGDHAFDSITMTGDIVLPNSLTEVGVGCFSTSILNSVYIPGSLKKIPEQMFAMCEFNGPVIVNEGITELEERAFGIAIFHSTISLPNTLTKIGDGAFLTATISQIELPSSLTEIGDSAFGHVTDLTSIVIPDSVTTIGERAFSACSIQNIKLSKNLKKIDPFTFYNCESLINVEMPENLEEIGSAAFEFCNQLKQIKFPITLKTIAPNAFYGVPLEKFYIPCCYVFDASQLIYYGTGENPTTFADRGVEVVRSEPEFGEWEVVEEPTLNSTGLRKKSCGGEHTITEVMPRLFAVNTADTYSIVIVVSIGIGFALVFFLCFTIFKAVRKNKE